MWRITWRCFNHEDWLPTMTTETQRSPYTYAVENPRCMACGKPMKMGAIEDLRPKGKIKRHVRRRAGGFGAAQLELFDRH